jgi:hypothetical protein
VSRIRLRILNTAANAALAASKPFIFNKKQKRHLPTPTDDRPRRNEASAQQPA